jgi:DNA invertase Pin-like site-specific DNA recombinase
MVERLNALSPTSFMLITPIRAMGTTCATTGLRISEALGLKWGDIDFITGLANVLRSVAAQRGFEIVKEYADRGVSGRKARRPGLDALMADARRRKFSVVLVAAFDRLARSTRHFLQLIDELSSLQIEFISRRENIDTSGPMGRLFLTLVSSIGELELHLIKERIQSGMRRAKLEGRQIGRARLDVDRAKVICDRRSGMSLTTVAKRHAISRASVCRLVKESNNKSAPAALVPAGNLAAHSTVGGDSR